MRLLRLFVLIFALASTVAAGDADLAPALVQRSKKATVLVDLGSGGSGSGFLVHASGLFVTNAHVVRKVPPGSPVKLILSSGLPEQEIVSARVVLVDEENDLALVKTDAGVAAEPLPLVDAAGLAELDRAVVFGYPFGTRLASESDSYPAISINVGRISSLRRDGTALERIQFDAVTNPGNTIGTYDPGTLGVPYEIVLSWKGKPVATAEGTLVFTEPPQGLDFDEATDGRNSYGGMKILPLIVPEQDGKQGSWVRVEKGLETKDEASAWCEMPVHPGNSYVLDVRVTPKQNGKGELLLWLPVGKTAALVRIDGEKGTMPSFPGVLQRKKERLPTVDFCVCEQAIFGWRSPSLRSLRSFSVNRL